MDKVLFHKLVSLFINKEKNEVTDSFLPEELMRCLDAFQPGNNYNYIFDVKEMKYLYFSPKVVDVLGYHPQDLNLMFLMQQIHPDDFKLYTRIEGGVQHFLQKKNDADDRFKILYDYRLRNNKGEYLRLMKQVVQMHINHETNHILRFGMVSDITHLRKDGPPSLTIINMKNAQKVDFELPEFPGSKLPNPFTKREKVIIELIIQGLSSKDIADKLFISLFTVKNHRKNIFQKAGCSSVMQLISICIQNSWIEMNK